MEITTNLTDTKATIAVEGKLTVATSPSLEEAVHQVPESIANFDIDLTELEYISSAGLRVLVSTQKLAGKRGGAMRLLHPTDDVMEVFEMTGFDKILTFE